MLQWCRLGLSWQQKADAVDTNYQTQFWTSRARTEMLQDRSATFIIMLWPFYSFIPIEGARVAYSPGSYPFCLLQYQPSVQNKNLLTFSCCLKPVRFARLCTSLALLTAQYCACALFIPVFRSVFNCYCNNPHYKRLNGMVKWLSLLWRHPRPWEKSALIYLSMPICQSATQLTCEHRELLDRRFGVNGDHIPCCFWWLCHWHVGCD